MRSLLAFRRVMASDIRMCSLGANQSVGQHVLHIVQLVGSSITFIQVDNSALANDFYFRFVVG